MFKVSLGTISYKRHNKPASCFNIFTKEPKPTQNNFGELLNGFSFAKTSFCLKIHNQNRPKAAKL
jgi:hypothetical protein